MFFVFFIFIIRRFNAEIKAEQQRKKKRNSKIDEKHIAAGQCFLSNTTDSLFSHDNKMYTRLLTVVYRTTPQKARHENTRRA